MPGWGPYALAAQLVLVFLAPPFPLAGRNVFPSDIWCALWVAGGLLSFPRGVPRALRRYLAWTGVAVALVYAHGYFRPSLRAQLTQHYFFGLSETDLFQAGRELVVALRFLSWIWAAGLSWTWFSGSEKTGRRSLNRPASALAACLLVAAGLMALESVWPGARAWLGGVYRYDPSFHYWRDRVYGLFQSPVEGAIAGALGGILLFARAEMHPLLRAASLLGAALIVGLARTATPFVVAVAVGAGFAWMELRGRRRLLAPAFVTAAIVLVAVVASHPEVGGKLDDLKFRFGPWSLYLATAASRLDLLLLGFGFAPYHADNSYVLILNRAGLFGFGLVVFFVGRALVRSWKAWPASERLWLTYLLVVGLTFDAVIYRHVVMCLVALGIPALASFRDRNRP